MNSLVKGLWKAVLIAVVFSCLPAHAAELDRIVAVVNNEAITMGELWRAIEVEFNRRGVPTAEREKAFKQNAPGFLDEMIEVRLELQEAGRLGIAVPDREVQEAIENIGRENSLSAEQFAEALRKEGFTLELYRERLIEEMTLGRVVDREVRSRVIVTDKEIRARLEGTADEPLYKIRQIFVKEDEARALALYDRLKAGEDFPALARQYSEDPTSEAGGDLGYLRESELGEEFIEALKDLKPGGVSRPFMTPAGIHIIKLEGAGRLDEWARKTLYEEKFAGQYRLWLKGLREKSFIEIRLPETQAIQ